MSKTDQLERELHRARGLTLVARINAKYHGYMERRLDVVAYGAWIAAALAATNSVASSWLGIDGHLSAILALLALALLAVLGGRGRAKLHYKLRYAWISLRFGSESLSRDVQRAVPVDEMARTYEKLAAEKTRIASKEPRTPNLRLLALAQYELYREEGFPVPPELSRLAHQKPKSEES